MFDLVERLRNFEDSDELGNGDFSLMIEAADALETARVEVGGLQRQLRQTHKDYGYELHDPNGTIWEHAANMEAYAQRLEAKVDRLAEALKQARESIEEWAYFAQSCGGEITGLQKELSEIDEILCSNRQGP